MKWGSSVSTLPSPLILDYFPPKSFQPLSPGCPRSADSPGRVPLCALSSGQPPPPAGDPISWCAVGPTSSVILSSVVYIWGDAFPDDVWSFANFFCPAAVHDAGDVFTPIPRALNWKVHFRSDLRLALLYHLSATLPPECSHRLAEAACTLPLTAWHSAPQKGFVSPANLHIQFSWIWMRMSEPCLALIPEDSHC